ncbi:unnamed protein product [Danaus chrysippus]|uniref:(African queen) hypothetical protein n=1 Tax=Danaus chrysippus TaxID=151541 RepID=A0A8J2QL49_9NEOP|nr:unnamed protein product [Danaus chrysippus]
MSADTVGGGRLASATTAVSRCIIVRYSFTVMMFWITEGNRKSTHVCLRMEPTHGMGTHASSRTFKGWHMHPERHDTHTSGDPTLSKQAGKRSNDNWTNVRAS